MMSDSKPESPPRDSDSSLVLLESPFDVEEVSPERVEDFPRLQFPPPPEHVPKLQFDLYTMLWLIVGLALVFGAARIHPLVAAAVFAMGAPILFLEGHEARRYRRAMIPDRWSTGAGFEPAETMPAPGRIPTESDEGATSVRREPLICPACSAENLPVSVGCWLCDAELTGSAGAATDLRKPSVAAMAASREPRPPRRASIGEVLTATFGMLFVAGFLLAVAPWLTVLLPLGTLPWLLHRLGSHRPTSTLGTLALFAALVLVVLTAGMMLVIGVLFSLSLLHGI